MRKKCLQILSVILLAGGLFLSQKIQCHAQTYYSNTETGYQVIIDDDAQLLTPEQLEKLADTMRGITAYGNVAFKTISSNSYDTDDYAQSYYRTLFGKDSGTLFLIDMDNRNLYIFSDGKIYRTITKSYANTITDNVYRYATGGDYFTCANKAFSQILTLLEGSHIMQPMKYISNALLSMLLGMLLCFGWICFFSRLKKPTDEELLKKIHKQFSTTPPTAVCTHETKTYSPVSSDSGSSSSSSGGGSSSGSSSSGGGGGHSF